MNIQTFDIAPEKKCKKCLGRGYVGVIVAGVHKGRKQFCPKCVIPVARQKLRESGHLGGTVDVQINLK